MMRRRCQRESCPGYQYYGGRGITVDQRWEDFDTFVRDMGPRPDGATLDRINNDAGYSPGNCRWATPVEQASNKRSNTKVTFKGETLTLTEWWRRAIGGISHGTVIYRHYAGWMMGDILSTPPMNSGGRRPVQQAGALCA